MLENLPKNVRPTCTDRAGAHTHNRVTLLRAISTGALRWEQGVPPVPPYQNIIKYLPLGLVEGVGDVRHIGEPHEVVLGEFKLRSLGDVQQLGTDLRTTRSRGLICGRSSPFDRQSTHTALTPLYVAPPQKAHGIRVRVVV